ncbi:hypothetical protein ABPG74_014728 [Tetrahymena malaccensis]
MEATNQIYSKLMQLVQQFSKESNLRKLEHLIVLIALVKMYKNLNKNGGFFKNCGKMLIRLLKKSSVISQKLTKELQTEAAKTVNQQFEGKPLPKFTSLPSNGLQEEEILEIMKERKAFDLDPTKGKCWAYVYDHSHKHTEFVTKAHNLFIHTNALNPMKFISLRNFEIEIVAMTAKMMNGDPFKCVGSVTSGGSESLLLAVKTYRDRLHKINPEITEPELIMCVSGHPAINKASHYYGVKIVYVESDPKTFEMRVDQIIEKINKNTCCIIASAPSYPHGIVDPIDQISIISERANIPLHVDSAIGGFMLPFIEKLGYKIPQFDFRNNGVTSISADVHKYGYSAKGASVLVFKDSEYRLNQFYSYTGWPGGIYISPTTLGTRGGGPLAGAWASMMVLGQDGFMDVTKKIIDGANYIRDEIRKIEELEILGNPVTTIIAFRVKKNQEINIYHISDALKDINDWQVENQRFPECIHISFMPQHVQIKEQFIIDLKKAINIVKENPKKYAKEGTAAMYGMMGMVPDEEVLEEFMAHFMDSVYKMPSEKANS